MDGRGVGGAVSCEELEELLDSRELEDPCGGGEMREFLASLGLTLSEEATASVGFSGSTSVSGLMRARSSPRALSRPSVDSE